MTKTLRRLTTICKVDERGLGCALRVYIAGSSAELERAEAAMALARNAGLVVTYDWTTDIRRARESGHATDATLPAHEQARAARADLDGVGTCDVLWLLVPACPSVGAWFEAGNARGLGKRLAMSGVAPGRIWDHVADLAVWGPGADGRIIERLLKLSTKST